MKGRAGDEWGQKEEYLKQREKQGNLCLENEMKSQVDGPGCMEKQESEERCDWNEKSLDS